MGAEGFLPYTLLKPVQNFIKQTKNSNLLTTILTGVSPNTACFLDPRLSVQEILPLLLIILQPTFRPVSTVKVFLIICSSHSQVSKRENIPLVFGNHLIVCLLYIYIDNSIKLTCEKFVSKGGVIIFKCISPQLEYTIWEMLLLVSLLRFKFWGIKRIIFFHNCSTSKWKVSQHALHHLKVLFFKSTAWLLMNGFPAIFAFR